MHRFTGRTSTSSELLHLSKHNLNHHVATREVGGDSRAEPVLRPELLHLSEHNLNHHVATRELGGVSRAEPVLRPDLLHLSTHACG